jgi:hypothetical protein
VVPFSCPEIIPDEALAEIDLQLLAQGRIQYWIGGLQMVWRMTFLASAHVLIASREVLRKKISPALFFVFNVVFISLAQNILLFLVSTPTYVMLLVSRFNGTMGTADIIFARILMGLILVEFLADQQQWSEYHSGIRDITYLTSPWQITRKQRKPTRKAPKCHQVSIKKTSIVGLW